MKNLLLLIFLFTTIEVFSQDTIHLKDSSIISAKIIEVSETEILYRLNSDSLGNINTLLTKYIFKIIYANGSVGYFKQPIINQQDSLEGINQPIIINQQKPDPNFLILHPPATKKNFLRVYFTDIFTHKLSFGYERLLNKKYSIELDCFYKYPTEGDFLPSVKWRRSFTRWYEGGEIRVGGSKHFQIDESSFSIGASISYRQQILLHKHFDTGPETSLDIGRYVISQKRKGVGVFLKFSVQPKARESCLEFFVLPGIYATVTKNQYHRYVLYNSSGMLSVPSTTDPNQIPELKTWYMKDGFYFLPYINFGLNYRFKQPEKGLANRMKIRSKNRIEIRDSLSFSRKNILLYNPTQLIDGAIGFTYCRIYYKRAISFINSVALSNGNRCTVSTGMLAEGNRNYFLSKKNFDISTSVNYNFSEDQQSFLFLGALFRAAQFNGTCYRHDFVLNKYYSGLSLGCITRSDIGLSFLMSFGTGVYFNHYIKNNPNEYMKQYGAKIFDIGPFANMSIQFGYSF